MLRTSAGTGFDTGTVVIAAGVGAFEPVRLKVKGAAECEGRSLWYRVTTPDLHAGRDVVVLGGGDSALDWALNLEGRARSVTIVHRRSEFRAAPASVARMQALCDEGRMRQMHGNVTAVFAHDGLLDGIEVTGPDGERERLALEHLLVFFGLSPKLGPIAEWGVALQKNAVVVDTERFQTSVPGIFAIGDVNTYPGKKKLILSGFHEAALAAFAIRQHLYPDEKVRVQYSTTSRVVHERLGVDDPPRGARGKR